MTLQVHLKCLNHFLRKHFGLASRAHIALFPHVLWPLTSVGHVGSLFMVVAIAHERHAAVCHADAYATAMLQDNAVREGMIHWMLI